MVTGLATSTYIGTYHFQMYATDVNGFRGSTGRITFQVLPPITISPSNATPLPSGTLGVAIGGGNPNGFLFSATGGQGPYTWSHSPVTGNTGWPRWATLNPTTGYATGTPSVLGDISTYRFNVYVTDANGKFADSGTYTYSVY